MLRWGIIEDDVIELLGKVMAQILSIIALSTKAMMERQISELGYSLCPSFLLTIAQRGFKF